MNSVKKFFLKSKLRVDLVIFILLYIPVTVLGIIAQVLYVLFSALKNPLIMVPILYVFNAFAWYAEPFKFKDSFRIIKLFTITIKESGNLLKVLGLLCLIPIGIFVLEKVAIVLGVGSVGDLLGFFDRRYDVRERIKMDLQKLKEIG